MSQCKSDSTRSISRNEKILITSERDQRQRRHVLGITHAAMQQHLRSK